MRLFLKINSEISVSRKGSWSIANNLSSERDKVKSWTSFLSQFGYVKSWQGWQSTTSQQMNKFYFTSKVLRMNLCPKIISILEQVLKSHLFILSTSPILVQKSLFIKFVVILINYSYLLMLLLNPIKLYHFRYTLNALKLLLKLDILNSLMTMIVSSGIL